MSPIDDALADLESRDPGEQFSYTEIAAKHGVVRSTLTRRHKGQTHPNEAKATEQLNLSPQQELELVRYISWLTEQGLSPTREMIQNFGSQIASHKVSESWVTRFLTRHNTKLTSQWTTGIERARHLADSGIKYKLYFSLLHHKMEEYKIEEGNTYNMDEKGFLIGVIGRSKRIFSKAMWMKKQVRASIQDGNREWITVLVCVCADGSALPPSIIYQAANGAIRDTWVEDIEASEHSVHVASSPSGWTNDDIGLAWLEQVFDRHTKVKCRRSWRLLILDGHGSHLTMDFIEYCHRNRILLSVFPPHSTHTLQPLDVVMFKPLSSAYSRELTLHQHQALGLNPIRKADFFPLFWSAWVSSFKKETIKKSFEACGIWPMDAAKILKKFTHTPSDQDGDQRSDLRLSPANWRDLERLVRDAVKDTHQEESKKLSLSLHQLSVQNELLLHENSGLKEALHVKKKRKKHGKALDFEQDKQSHGGAVFYSPHAVHVARDLAEIKERDKEEKQIQKLRRKQEKIKARRLKQSQIEEKRKERERAKVVREKERAEKAAKREPQKQLQNTKKTALKPQGTKRKASKAIPLSNKRQKRVGSGTASVEAQEVPSSSPPKVTSRGRPVTLPKKFK